MTLKLTAVALENFKRHENTVVNFTGGVNVINGPNYAGKSTILQAILFAFFGAKAIPCDADDMVRRGAKRMRVCVTVAIGPLGSHDSVYEVERTKSGATVTYKSQGVEERVEATGHSAVTTWVENLIGMKAKRFAQLKYAEQKETEALLAFGTTELHALLEELSGADTVNAAIKRCSDIQAECNAVIGVLGEVSAIDPVEGRKELAAKTHQHDAAARGWSEARQREQALHARIGELEHEVSQAVAHNNGVSNRRQRYGQCLARVEDAGLRVAAAQERLRTLTGPDVALKAGNLSAARLALSEHRQAIAVADAAARAVADWRARLDAVNQKLAKAGDDVTKDTKSAEGWQAQVDASRAAFEACVAHNGTIDDLRRQDRDTRDKMAALRADKARIKAALEASACPTCKRDYDHAAGHRQALEAELAAVQTQGEAIAGAVNQIVEAMTAVQGAALRLSADERHLQQAEDGLAEAIRNLNRLQEAKADLLNSEPEGAGDVEQRRAAVPTLQAEIAELEKLERDTALAEAAVRNEQESLARAQAELAAVPEIGEELPVPADRLATLRAERHDVEAEVETWKADEQRLQAAITRLQDDIEREEKLAARRDTAKRRRDTAKALWAYLRENRDRFMGEIWASVMAAASGFVAACTGGDIERVFRDPEGKFRYVEKGEEFSALGSASGAQRSLMGLGIKLAMSQLARSDLNVALLDEPSADMDTKVSAAMTALLGSMGQQVIMVSHREMDSSMAENVITLEG